MFLTAQWRLRHTGSSGMTQVFVYYLYWRTRACLLCMCVPPPTVPLHKVINSGSFHWALSLLIYFRYLIILRPPLIRGQGRSQRKISGVVKVTFGNDYDVIDVQSTMMRLFCYDQLTNIGGGTFYIAGGPWASEGGTKWAFPPPANWHTNQIC